MAHSLFIVSLNSRLGLQNPPIGSNVNNIGVEFGGIKIFKRIKKQLGIQHRFLEINFPLPENLSSSSFRQTLFKTFRDAANQIDQLWKDQELLISLGGDHSISSISVSSVLKRFNPKKTGLLVFDSHAGLNTFKTSSTGNYHGMWLRSFVDPVFSQLVHKKNITTNFKNIRFVGNLELDDSEIQYINKNNVKIYTSTDTNSEHFIELSNWIHELDHLHISFDIDVFAEHWVSSTGTPNPNGFTPIEVFSFLEVIRNHPSISLDIVELNPLKPACTKALSLITQVLQYLLNQAEINEYQSDIEDTSPSLGYCLNE